MLLITHQTYFLIDYQQIIRKYKTGTTCNCTTLSNLDIKKYDCNKWKMVASDDLLTGMINDGD